MNYGKIAYLKTLDLEQRLNNIGENNEEIFTCSEYSYDTYNEKFTTMHEIDYDGVLHNGNVCLQSKIKIRASQEEEITVKILANGEEIGKQVESLRVGDNDIIIYKTYISDEIFETNFQIIIESESATEKTIKSINSVMLGAKGNALSSEVELRAIKTASGICVSYIQANKLFVATSEYDGDLNFEYIGESISHSIIEKDNENAQKLQIFSVNNEKELYLCDFNLEKMLFIDSDVARVFARRTPKDSDTDLIVCYIKNGRPMYRTIKDNNLSVAREFALPGGKYVDIRIVDSDDDFVYVVATNDQNANYILKSILEVSTGKFVENIRLSADVLVMKYVHLPMLGKIVENINVGVSAKAFSYRSFEHFGDNPLLDNITLSLSANATSYEVKEETTEKVTYGVNIDFTNSNPVTSVTYSDDAAAFTGAYMDFASDVFVDNGWTSRWPFNEIKPCLVDRQGNVVGYLNPNDYSQLEDGTPVDIETAGNVDVMVEIPRVDYHMENIDEYHVSIKITNDFEKGFSSRAFTYKGNVYDKIYIAAYHSKWVKGTDGVTYEPYSISGTPDRKLYNSSLTMTSDEMITNTRAKMLGYEHCPFNVYILLQVLYVIMFKNLNSQEALGHGVLGVSTLVKTGILDKAGMYYGKTDNTPIKLFGIENVYGNGSVFLPGMFISSGYEVYVQDPMNAAVDYKYPADASGLEFLFKTSGNVMVTYTTKVSVRDDLGFITTKNGGSSTTYLCDKLCFRMLQRSYRTSGFSSDTEIGIFGLVNGDNANRNENISRMVYFKRSQ